MWGNQNKINSKPATVCAHQTLCLGHTRTHTYPSAYTQKERERVYVCVLVATCVCQTCRSDTPADTLKVWRWTEGNKCVPHQPVWRRLDNLHSFLNQSIGAWSLCKEVKNHTQKDRQELPVYPRDWKRSVTWWKKCTFLCVRMCSQ